MAALPTPPSLSRLCRQALPQILKAADGKRMVGDVARIAETDRWNSFDRFHDTTQTLSQLYEQAGARVEVTSIQTGRNLGDGRWVIQEAQDVVGAVADVVSPVRERILDYRDNPWHVVQWTAATPRKGLRCPLVIIDDEKELDRLPVGALDGAAVLTQLDIRTIMDKLDHKGAVAGISDHAVPNNPDAVQWTKFGWGAVPMSRATANLIGLVLSQKQGQRLRRLQGKHGQLTLHLKVDVRKYAGTHDVVCGVVEGAQDPQDEVWAFAHSAEPGALDNASGCALTVEVARILEGLIASGALPRPRRSIRLVNGYECYGFFGYLERAQRLQTPLAGVNVDTVGSKAAVCNGRLEWHATVPMSAGFVDWIGEKILRSTLRQFGAAGYGLVLDNFMETSDTLIGDPQYGFPCPWITTHHQQHRTGFDAYHSSADTMALVSAPGLKTCASATAAYLYYLANADSDDVAAIANVETERLTRPTRSRKRLKPAEATYIRDAHDVSLRQLRRWAWGGDRSQIERHLRDCQTVVTAVTGAATGPRAGGGRTPAQGRRVPRRTGLLTPENGNVPNAIVARLKSPALHRWALYWADGKRSLSEIQQAISVERSGFLSPLGKTGDREIELQRVIDFFEAHVELGYAELPQLEQMLTKKQLIADLRRLGVREGMDVMVHSSLSSIGHVSGGADTVVDALLGVVGRSGTLLMPSFNHGLAQVYNPMTTPTTNGAIPNAMWRRPLAERSMHPTHAVAAIGARAPHYCRDHLETGIWDQESPIGKLIHGGGYILALGVNHQSSTAYHVAEMSVPCGCLDPFANTDRVLLPDGSVKEVLGLGWRESACPVPVSPKLDAALDRRGLQRRGKVGEAECELVLGHDLWRLRREHLRGACPTCPIKPTYR
jgi:aminoglycoside 3-N-acetyltransferase